MLAWRLRIASAVLVFLCGPSPARPADVAGPEALFTEARRAGLAIHPQWLRLGHYRRDLAGRWRSEVDGAAFFLSGSGRSDPESELEATLRSIFLPPGGGADDDHALCAFPARSAWLREELGIAPAALPAVSCTRFAEFHGRIDPVSATFVFSSYYLNNPVSAFGHTFLRINSAASLDAPARRELLDYGIDYAAVTGQENAVLYAFKGLFGMFPGRFSAMPYYYKVRKYNDMESRDIWQYDLSLTPQETRFLVMHLWELGRTYMDYWYLTENCSYHILGLLEAARPDLDLTSPLAKPVLPGNTVKAVVAERGLVTGTRYRPSIRSQFRERIRGLDGQQLTLVERLAADAAFPLPEDLASADASAAFDAAIDLVERRYFSDLVADPGGSAARKKQRLLERRAALGVASPDLVLEPGRRALPHRGHDSRRAGAGAGASTDGGGFAEVSFRIALHDLLDPSPGYPETAQIEFLPARLRYFPRDDRVRLEEGYFVRVLSLSPRDRFEKDFSWKVAAGATTVPDGGCSGGCPAAHLGAGGGLSWEWQEHAVLLWATVDADLFAAAGLEGGIGDGPVRAGLGPGAGLRLRPHPSLVGLFAGKWSLLPGQDPGDTWQAEGGLRWSWTRNLAAGLHAAAHPVGASVGVTLYRYF